MVPLKLVENVFEKIRITEVSNPVVTNVQKKPRINNSKCDKCDAPYDFIVPK